MPGAIGAVVAGAYGLSRHQYAHVLSTFKHTSYPKAPELCLARFDELKSIGLDAFTKKHDPYWDIPLNENLPEPVIELPGLAVAATVSFALAVRPAGGIQTADEKPDRHEPGNGPSETRDHCVEYRDRGVRDRTDLREGQRKEE